MKISIAPKGYKVEISAMKDSGTISIRTISADQTYSIRHQVLRPNAPLEKCQFEGDFEADSFHLGAFAEGKLIGVASFRKESCLSQMQIQNLIGSNSFRLRGMATLPECRGLGVGRALLLQGEKLLRAKNCTLLWFNAREIAFPFYEKLGYEYNSEMFEIAEVGPHKIMYKFL